MQSDHLNSLFNHFNAICELLQLINGKKLSQKGFVQESEIAIRPQVNH